MNSYSLSSGMASGFLGLVLLPGGGVRFDEALQRFDRRQGDEVAGDEKLLVESGGGVVYAGLFFVGAEDESHWRLVALGHHFGFPVVEIEIHLPGVAVLEGSGLEVNE